MTLGPSACKKLLNGSGDSDLFEDILSFIKDIAYDDSVCNKEGLIEIERNNLVSEEMKSASRTEGKNVNVVTFLSELSSIDNFDFLKAMIDKSVLRSVSEWIRGKIADGDAQATGEEEARSTDNAVELQELASRFH